MLFFLLLISLNFLNGCLVLTTIIIAFYLLPQTTKTCVCLVRRNPSFLEFSSKYNPRHGWQAMFSLPSSFPFICLVLSKLVISMWTGRQYESFAANRVSGELFVHPLRHFFFTFFVFFLFFPEQYARSNNSNAVCHKLYEDYEQCTRKAAEIASLILAFVANCFFRLKIISSFFFISYTRECAIVCFISTKMFSRRFHSFRFERIPLSHSCLVI